MTTIKLNITTKNLESNTKYHNATRSYLLGQEATMTEAQELFHLQNLDREVKRLKKPTKKQILKICKITLATSASVLMLVNPKLALAATIVQQTTGPLSPEASLLLPEDIVKAGMYLIGICAVASTILAIILTQLAGNYRMFRKGKEASEWMTDILKGYTQVILAPVLILLIAFVCYIFFGDLKWFVKPF